MINLRYRSETLAFNRPAYIQAELTRYCPASCPQCYMNKSEFHMPRELFENLIGQMKAMGIDAILLTGGEPLCSPYIEDAVYLSAKNNISPVIATSGIGLSESLAVRLKKSGLYKICVSLNGSAAEIHNRSRSHFHEGLQAVNTAVKSGLDVVINWVARRDNYLDFPEMYRLGEGCGVSAIDILSNKKNRAGSLSQALTEDDEKKLSEYVFELKSGKTEITTELCYFSLNKRLNPHRSKLYQSCMAGRAFTDYLADGRLCPCRHLGVIEKDDKLELENYWLENEELNIIRRQSAFRDMCHGIDETSISIKKLPEDTGGSKSHFVEGKTMKEA